MNLILFISCIKLLLDRVTRVLPAGYIAQALGTNL